MRIQRPVLTLHVALAFIWACESSAAPPAAAPTVKLLNSSGEATGRGGNEMGQIVGLGFTEGLSSRALLWSSLTADPIELPGRGGYTVVSALNRHGVAVGNDYATADPSSTTVAVRWVNGERQALGVPTGWAGSMAADINDLGVVAGAAEDAQRIGAPFIWTLNAGFVLLDMPTTSRGGNASRISECGAVAGFLFGQETPHGRAFVWDAPGAPARELVTLPGGYTSGAYDINCIGEVAGYSNDGTEPSAIWAVKWRANGAPIRLPNPADLDAIFSWADGIDERGNVVGTVIREDDTRLPVLWPATGGVIDLSTLVPGFVTGYPSAILADGTIVGTVSDGTRQYAAVWLGFLAQ